MAKKKGGTVENPVVARIRRWETERGRVEEIRAAAVVVNGQFIGPENKMDDISKTCHKYLAGCETVSKFYSLHGDDGQPIKVTKYVASAENPDSAISRFPEGWDSVRKRIANDARFALYGVRCVKVALAANDILRAVDFALTLGIVWGQLLDRLRSERAVKENITRKARAKFKNQSKPAEAERKIKAAYSAVIKAHPEALGSATTQPWKQSKIIAAVRKRTKYGARKISDHIPKRRPRNKVSADSRVCTK